MSLFFQHTMHEYLRCEEGNRKYCKISNENNTVQGARNYCAEDVCNNSKQHTLCKYQSEQPAPNCINYELLIKDEKDKLSVLNKINDRRNKVAAGDIRSLPSAENMMKLAWNEELATSAQRWADQCVQHSTPDVRDTCRDLGDIAVGQNIATIYGEAPGLTPVALVDVWYTELLNINATVITRYLPSMEVSSLHYDYFTQLVWADSSEVGCGAVKFKQGAGAQRNQTVYRLICNFAPSGNRIGETVYADGTPCLRCPEKGSCDNEYTSLCSLSARSVSNITTVMGSLDDENILSTQNLLDGVASATESYDHNSVEDDTLSAIDYLFQINNYTTEKNTVMPEKQTSCKNTMEIDELLDLLKRKLSTDPMFQNMITTVTPSDRTENGLGDSGVKAFVNKIYNQRDASITTRAQEIANFNPTLLADLVEAVIFRSDKYSVANLFESTTAIEASEINPVKIQAELAEVKQNDGFTGHYFFPEDENIEDEENIKSGQTLHSETSDSYYDANREIPISDVVMELEVLKKHATKDFIDEILESEPVTESVAPTTTEALLPDVMGLFKSGHNNMKKFLEEIGDKNLKLNPAIDFYVHQNKEEGDAQQIRRKRGDHSHEIRKDINEENNVHKYGDFLEASRDLKENNKGSSYYLIGYKQLLQKISRDIKQLNLPESFHCSRCASHLHTPVVFILIMTAIL